MSWTIRDTDLRLNDPEFLGTIFCVGNGAMCTRGTPGEARHDAFRGVYVSGLYTRAPWGIMYFLGAPDWLCSFVRVDGTVAAATESTWELDMRRGTVTRRALLRRGDTTVKLVEERFMSLADRHVAGQRLTVRRVSGEGAFEVVAGIDGEVRQSRAKYYQPGQYPNCIDGGIKLAAVESVEATAERLGVALYSRQTRRRVRALARVVRSAGSELAVSYGVDDGRALATWRVPAGAAGSGEFAFDKTCVLTADLEGRERAVEDGDRCFAALGGRDYPGVLAAHVTAMEEFWAAADVVIEGDEAAQRATRFSLWSTRSSAPDDDGFSSMGAKNLTGDWYRGAVFWDMEVYQLPMLTAVAPDLARNHVLYRCKRLDSARRLAAQDGFPGARYPGQSYDTGIEDPPALGGLALMEIHVSFEVAWGIRFYYALTGDRAAMLDQGGLETVLEIANFWSSKVTRDQDGSYHLRTICGPDELHKPVDDNAYMNRMIAELLDAAPRLIDGLGGSGAPEVARVLANSLVDENALERWRDVAARINVPMIDGVTLDQFAGHGAWPEPSPRLLKEKGMGADKIGKQADTLMLFQTVPWVFSREQILANYRTYAPLCNQTSSLSLCSHALVAARLGLSRDARFYYGWAAGVDLDDSMGNSAHGIHGAGQGGIWLVVVQGFGGLQVAPEGVAVDPHLPRGWSALTYRFRHLGNLVEVAARPDSFTVTNHGPQRVSITLAGQARVLAPGGAAAVPTDTRWSDQRIEAVVIDLDSVAAAAGTGALGAFAGRLGRAGIRIAVVSARESCDEVLASVGMAARTDAVVDMRVCTRAKPDPQAYLTATQRLRSLPWNCAGLASDAAGIEALRRAGIPAIALGTSLPGANHVAATLDELTGEVLARLVDSCTGLVNPYLERNIAIMKAEAEAKN